VAEVRPSNQAWFERRVFDNRRQLGVALSVFPAHTTPVMATPELVQSLLSDAQKHVDNEDFPEARKCFSKLIELLPGHPMPLLSRCTCFVQEGLWMDAIPDALTVLRLDDGPVDENIAPGCSTYHSVAYVRLAKCYHELGQMENYQMVMERRKEIEERVAKAKANATDATPASTSTAASSADAPVDKTRVEQLKQKGNKHFKAGEYEQAIQAYCEGLELDPNNHVLHSNACQAMLRHGNLKEAKHHAERCVELKPSWPKGHYRLGTVLLQLEEYNEAVKALEKAMSLVKQQGMPYDATLAAALEEARAKQASTPKKPAIASSVKNTLEKVEKMNKGVGLEALMVLISVGLGVLAIWYLQYQS
jgi:tetratricopeptide (TPR) repeat protein